ncbi:hypothetical protein VCHA56P521_20223 [Vibrio chagasii]|nr:hypothetical protein VCHA36P168_30242 [Vibrio chagasii]CAH7282651.1 hypothetical protein VCHA52P461_30242 [Vibrio chagasii]CAH7373290.1 hypothetical protein VCHA37P203_20244 [Vibrio chagasii]CAH7385738.1 hypothetical protein VCHA56P521_20223 [Vibrio chagasii]
MSELNQENRLIISDYEKNKIQFYKLTTFLICILLGYTANRN